MYDRETGFELIPEHMQGAMQRWIEDGIMPGSFLEAVLSNDLRRAVHCADNINILYFPVYMQFLQNYAPIDCWGSPENVDYWHKMGGLHGIERAHDAEIEAQQFNEDLSDDKS